MIRDSDYRDNRILRRRHRAVQALQQLQIHTNEFLSGHGSTAWAAHAKAREQEPAVAA